MTRVAPGQSPQSNRPGMTPWRIPGGIVFFRDLRVRHIGLVGHAFAGAVAIRAAVYSGQADTVVTLAAQSHGAGWIKRLPSFSSGYAHGCAGICGAEALAFPQAG